MKNKSPLAESLTDWSRIPGRLRDSIRGLKAKDLGLTSESEGWSIRETVHHLVEANLIASNMIIAALAAIRPLAALSAHMTGLIAAQPDSLARTVKLNDSPGAPATS